jgi:hypothetical protein
MKNLGHRCGFANRFLKKSAIRELGNLAQSKNQEQQLRSKTTDYNHPGRQRGPLARQDQNYFLLSVGVLYQKAKFFQILIIRGAECRITGYCQPRVCEPLQNRER